MASLDKDQVIEKFTRAFADVNGKDPKIEAKGGWYSVDGGKNMRLAQLNDMADELASGGNKTEKAAQAKPAKKAATSKPAAKKAKKPVKPKGGFSVKSHWNEQIKQANTGAILPR